MEISRLKDQYLELKAAFLSQLEQMQCRKAACRPAADDAHAAAIL